MSHPRACTPTADHSAIYDLVIVNIGSGTRPSPAIVRCRSFVRGCNAGHSYLRVPGVPPNALVQLQAHYHHCGEAASEKCLSAATFVRQARGYAVESARCQRRPATPR